MIDDSFNQTTWVLQTDALRSTIALVKAASTRVSTGDDLSGAGKSTIGRGLVASLG